MYPFLGRPHGSAADPAVSDNDTGESAQGGLDPANLPWGEEGERQGKVGRRPSSCTSPRAISPLLRGRTLAWCGALVLTAACGSSGGQNPSPPWNGNGGYDAATAPDGATPTTPDGAAPTNPDSAAPTNPDAGVPTDPDGAAPSGDDGGSDAAATDDGGTDPGLSDGSIPDPDASVPPEQAAPPLSGCDQTRPAIALHPGAEPVEPAPANAPFPCAAPTGLGAPFNTSVAVTSNGRVLFAPAHSTGVVASDDHGATFKGPLNDPPAENAGLWGHPWLTRDPDSGRLFFTLYNSFLGPCPITGHNYWYSDDDGESWVEMPAGVGCGSWDWGKIITGPAATAASKAALEKNGYPNLVYFCAGGAVYALGTHHYCYRSTDGGLTFTRTKADAVDPARGQVGWPNAGAIAPDGTFYKVHGSQGKGVTLVMSEDEGDSWRVTQIPDTALGTTPNINFLASNVATDSEGNLYVVWVDDRDTLPYLVISRDRGKTWLPRMMVGAPEVKVATNINVAAREPGYVAINYYGSPQSESTGDGYAIRDGRPYNAYITVTTNVFVERPVFWSATINDPETPTLSTGINLLVSEYIGPPIFGPDGSIWAGFLVEDKGLVGRLSPPPR